MASNTPPPLLSAADSSRERHCIDYTISSRFGNHSDNEDFENANAASPDHGRDDNDDELVKHHTVATKKRRHAYDSNSDDEENTTPNSPRKRRLYKSCRRIDVVKTATTDSHKDGAQLANDGDDADDDDDEKDKKKPPQ